MTPKTLKWLLGASVVVNLFLIAGLAAGGWAVKQHMHDRKPMRHPWNDVEAVLTPQSREHVKDVVKAAALKTEPEMNQARELRAEAEKLAAEEPYNTARIVDLAEQARSYENMSRAKIETTLIQDLATLPAKERAAVAGYILRPGFRIRRVIDSKPTKPAPAAGAPR